MITLRPYQEKILHELRVALRSHRSALVCAPPGAGKGSLIAYMVHSAVSKGKRIIFAVRGRALVQDMHERVSRLGVEHGVLMGGRRRERWHPVQVASIDTLHRMEQKPPCDLLILDEARQFNCPTGRKVIEEYPGAKIVGADGTPALIDGRGLGVSVGGIFEAIVHGPNEQELIEMGFLVPSIPIGIATPPDVSKVKKSGGDFNQKDLAAVCDKVKLVGDLVQHWLKYANGLKTVAFGVDQAHAKHITEEFQRAGVEWGYVDANTPDDERTELWNRLDHGTLMGFSNVMIAGVGWDHPVIQCVLCARPTTSLPLWRQMIGRASRPYPGKKSWVLLDHAGNLTRPGIYPYSFFETPPAWSLEGTANRSKATDDEPRPTPVAMCKVPIPVPESGPLPGFTGPLSPDGRYMLPSYHCFRAGPPVCPYCGIPLRIGGREVDVEAGDLHDLSAVREQAKAEQKAMDIEQWREKVTGDDRRKKYLEFVQIAHERGYKKTWPAVKFKVIFGKWPDKGWVKDHEANFTDPLWDLGAETLRRNSR